MLRNQLLLSVAACASLFLMTGCGSSGNPAKSPTGPTSATAALDASKGAESGDEKATNVDWPGFWRIEMTDQGIIREFGVLSISAGDKPGDYDIKTQALSSNYDAAVLGENKIDGDRIHLIFDGGPDLVFTFDGVRDSREVKGSLHIKKLHVTTMRMVKVESDILDGDLSGTPMEGYELFDKVAVSPEGEDGLRDFIQQYPDNPIILRAYEVMAGFAMNRKAPIAEVEKIHDAMIQEANRWGSLIAIRSSFEFGRTLARFNYFPDLARKYLSEFEQAMNDDSPKSWEIDLAATRAALGNHKEVIEQLLPVVEKNPNDHGARFILGFAYERSGDLDAAIKEYLSLTALPFMDEILKFALEGSKTDPLIKSLSNVWAKKYGNTNDLEKALDEEFLKGTSALIPAREDQPKKNDKTRTVLLELFTGTSCPPCIAADLAASGLQTRYPSPEVIVVRHHLHIPAPDPLAIAEGENRFKNYVQNDSFFQQHPETIGTPSLFVNGGVVSQIFGVGVDPVPENYKRLVESVRPLLGEETNLKISLEAVQTGDRIQVKAQAEGIELRDEYRLHLLLVENDLHFAAPNGIRVHDAVVRHYINGLDGTAPADKKLEFSTEVSLPDVATSLRKFIAKTEEKTGRIFAIPARLEKLQVVAFIQDTTNREVLQAAIVTPASSKP